MEKVEDDFTVFLARTVDEMSLVSFKTWRHFS
jgi:hypothetical protein